MMQHRRSSRRIGKRSQARLRPGRGRQSDSSRLIWYTSIAVAAMVAIVGLARVFTIYWTGHFSKIYAPTLTFKQAMLVGLADDGRLYVPREWPHFSAAKIRSFKGMGYAEVAFHVIKAFVDGEIDDAPLRAMIDEAYATFHHPAVVPLVQMGANNWVLEVFYGPTLAFKDVAMQILARLMDHILTEQGRRLTIVGATSGDTGGAALEAFHTCDGIDTFFMFPEGKVSDVQRKQMTTIGAANAHAIAIDGSFDDCQNMVKAMFNDPAFRDGVQLSAVNSINWGRVMAQTVYYFTAAVALGAPDRDIAFTVPTGNFGDIFAGFGAKQMGLGCMWPVGCQFDMCALNAGK